MINKKVIVLVFLLLLSTLLIPHKKINLNNKNYNVYIKENGTYVKSDLKTFGLKGYILDSNESSCSGGSTITQNPNTGEISVTTTKEDKCNLYFEKASSITLNKLHSLNNNIEIKNVSGYPKLNKASPSGSEFSDNGFINEEKTKTLNATDQSRYITYSSSYTFNTSTGKYTLDNPQVCIWSDCYNVLNSGTYYTGTVGTSTSSSATNYANRGNIYKISSNSVLNTMYYYINNYPNLISWDTNDVGLFSAEDNYGETLYFRGNIENNYFKFGKNANNDDMWWRIIRINGDGTIRLVYDGTEGHDNADVSNDRYIGPTKYNQVSTDNAYGGYMYGNFTPPSTSYEQANANEVSSTIKTFIDNWYVNNILNTGFSNYIADTLFCNDRSVDEGVEAFGTNQVNYSASYRASNPTFKCKQKNDSFTVNDNYYGNAALNNPIATISADVMWFAGKTIYNYLGRYNRIWTITPKTTNYVASGAMYVHLLLESGLVEHGWATQDYNYILPVINIKTDYLNNISGAGTKASPFYIST